MSKFRFKFIGAPTEKQVREGTILLGRILNKEKIKIKKKQEKRLFCTLCKKEIFTLKKNIKYCLDCKVPILEERCRIQSKKTYQRKKKLREIEKKVK